MNEGYPNNEPPEAPIPPEGPPPPPSESPGDDGLDMPDAGMGEPGGAGDGPAPQVVEFSPARFERELQVDAVMRYGIVVLAVLVITGLVLFGQSESILGLAVMLLLVFGWIAAGTVSANVWRSLPGVTQMIGRDPVLAEAGLATLMRRRPMMRWVRLLLYHRLAAVRHRQRRFVESAAICRAVLGQPLGPAGRQKGSLLLMLAEASLQCRDAHGAYGALAELHGMRLGLAERLQRLTIQTRYEVLTGHDKAALKGVRQKLLMAELMPAEHCGVMHAMLTASAKRTGQDELAEWLWRRSELLCGRERLDKLVRGAFAVGVVGVPEG